MQQQLAITFAETRSRRTDPQTSRDAARHAASAKSQAERAAIAQAVRSSAMGLTAKEVAEVTGIGYIETQRRISETGGIVRTTERRDGCAVWRALS